MSSPTPPTRRERAERLDDLSTDLARNLILGVPIPAIDDPNPIRAAAALHRRKALEAVLDEVDDLIDENVQRLVLVIDAQVEIAATEILSEVDDRIATARAEVLVEVDRRIAAAHRPPP